MANMPFVDRLEPDGREYFDFVFNKNKPKQSKLMFLYMAANIAINYFLIYFIANHQTETNLFKSLIYLNFSFGCLMTMVVSFLLTLVLLGMITVSHDKKKLLVMIKKTSYYKDSFIWNCFRFSSLISGIVFLITLATTNHIYIFLFSCLLELISILSLVIWKTAITLQLNSLTTEDVNKLVMHDVKETEKTV